MNLTTIPDKARWSIVQNLLNQNFQKILVELERASATTKTFYTSVAALNAARPTANEGDIAFVGNTFPGTVYEYINGAWTNTGIQAEAVTSLADYVLNATYDADLSKIRDDINIRPVSFNQFVYDWKDTTKRIKASEDHTAFVFAIGDGESYEYLRMYHPFADGSNNVRIGFTEKFLELIAKIEPNESNIADLQSNVDAQYGRIEQNEIAISERPVSFNKIIFDLEDETKNVKASKDSTTVTIAPDVAVKDYLTIDNPKGSVLEIKFTEEMFRKLLVIDENNGHIEELLPLKDEVEGVKEEVQVWITETQLTKNKVEGIEDDITEIKGDVQGANLRIDDANLRIDDTNLDVQGLSTDVDNLRNNVNEIQGVSDQIPQIKEDVTANKTSIEELTQKIKYLTPQRVESEEAMDAMIKSGQYDENQIYYVAEE